MDTSLIVTSIIFGVIGIGYFSYAGKQKKAVALICGFLLCALPYLITNLYILIPVCVACVLMPLIFRY